MNYRMVFSMVGLIMLLEGVLMLIPAAVSLMYGEESATAFLITVALLTVCGFSLRLLFKPKDRVIYAKDGLVIVALAWIITSLFGALPFKISGEVPSYVDSLFETVSGFTTTGASVITDLSVLSHGMLFWRSFTHWIGGMGVIVMIMAIFPTDSGRSMHVMRAEMPGPIVGKLVPRVKDTAKILYLIYIFLTALEVVFLVCGEMDLFDSVVHSLGTAGTGGFGIKPDSLGSYSAYSQWVITIFMLIFGVNFNLYFLILIGRIKSVLKSEELWVYLSIVVVTTATIAVNISGMFDTVGEAIRHSAFQVASIITTTGYATADFNLWPELSRGLLFILMFIGGCAGSTAGGLKVSRIIIMVKMTLANLKKYVHPRAVESVKFEGKTLECSTTKSVSTYVTVYSMIFMLLFLALCLDSFGFETNFTAVAACYNNIGPGLADVGPAGSFTGYSAFSKLVLSLAMLLGRLELYPILVILIPTTWARKRAKAA